MRGVPTCALLALPAFLLSNSFLVVAAETSCISNTTEIFEAEGLVEDPTVGGTRTYILCPNTTYNIGIYNSASNMYDDGMAALELAVPNVHILCGEDGKRENNCVLEGPDVLVAVFKFSDDGPDLSNIIVSGVTFQQAGFEVVNGVAKTDEEGVVFKDCLFRDNDNVGVVEVPVSEKVQSRQMTLVFDSCTFESNIARPLKPESDVTIGMVYNNGQIMNFSNCEFLNNSVPIADKKDAVTFLVGNVKGGKMTVADSRFQENTVSLALVYSEKSDTSLEGNIAADNSFFSTEATDESGCDGHAEFVESVVFEFDCTPFGVSAEPTGAPTTPPSSSPGLAEPTGAPTTPPSSSPGLVGGKVALVLTMAAAVCGSWF